MRIRTVGRRGVLFTFQDGDSPMGGETSVYLIEGGDRFYLCDTFLGSRFMNVVKDRIKESPRKDLVIFNSHSTTTTSGETERSTGAKSSLMNLQEEEWKKDGSTISKIWKDFETEMF